jgi:hypothetical protein
MLTDLDLLYLLATGKQTKLSLNNGTDYHGTVQSMQREGYSGHSWIVGFETIKDPQNVQLHVRTSDSLSGPSVQLLADADI